MKVCYLASASSIHTVRWANAALSLGHEVSLITMHPAEIDELDSKIDVYELKIRNKLGYYLNFFEVKSILKKLQPDILHVHYASGYGTLSRLVGFNPTLLSVWGSDVYLFPYQRKMNESTLKKNLKAAHQITSTSRAMAEQTKFFIDPITPIEIVPFGVDLEKFKVYKKKWEKGITIGTVKRLELVYGIDILIKAVAKLIDQLQYEKNNLAERINLKIIGNGSELENLKKLTNKLNINHITEFVSAIPNSEVPYHLNKFDIYCAFSHSESFGVAVIEASACELPVIVSDVGGFPEVVENCETGYIVDNQSLDEIVEKLLILVLDYEKRKEMGLKGRKFVERKYDWKQNVLKMDDIYRKLVKNNNNSRSI